MKTVLSACFGFALIGTAFAFAGAPASAVEEPALISKAPGNIIKVDERDRERCDRVRRDCRERHHDHEREYRECVTKDGCEP